MKTEDVIKIAYRRAVKDVHNSVYAEVEGYTDESRQSARTSLEGNLVYHFWWYIHHISHKKRSQRYDGSSKYADQVIDAFRESGVDIDITSHSLLRTEFTMNPLCINIINKQVGAEVYAGHIRMDFNIPPVDLVQYLVAFNDLHRHINETVDELMDESRKLHTIEKIQISAATGIIQKMSLAKDITYKLSVTSKGQILCVLTHRNDPTYRKSCRSDLAGLADAVNKTIPKLTAYRFTGYVEDV